MTYFHSQCCTDQFSFYSRAYFYLFISCAWWVHVPFSPQPQGVSSREEEEEEGQHLYFHLWKSCILSWHFSVLETGSGGSVCVLGCRSSVLWPWERVCVSVRGLRVRVRGCFRIHFWLYSLIFGACGGVSPARRGSPSLHTPSWGPRLWMGPTPSGF